MTDDDEVVPVGERLGSQRLFDGPSPPPLRPVAEFDSVYRKHRPRPQPETAATPRPAAVVAGGNPTTRGRGRSGEIASTVLELAGITAFTAGCWLIAPYLGLIVLGLCMIVLGVAMGWPER